jgi:hypothetical protein
VCVVERNQLCANISNQRADIFRGKIGAALAAAAALRVSRTATAFQLFNQFPRSPDHFFHIQSKRYCPGIIARPRKFSNKWKFGAPPMLEKENAEKTTLAKKLSAGAVKSGKLPPTLGRARVPSLSLSFSASLARAAGNMNKILQFFAPCKRLLDA